MTPKKKMEISGTESDAKNEEKEKEEEDLMAPRLGFDVVMQEDNVTVYKMPKCGHEMNPESLYHLALSRYSDKNNLSVECPHRWCEYPCKQQWDYHDILSILRRDGGDYEYHKLELLASRNRVQNGCKVQKCPKCDTLYFQNDSTAPDLGSIDSAESVEMAFKSECIYCSFVCRKWEAYYEEDIQGPPVEDLPANDQQGRFPLFPTGIIVDVDSDEDSDYETDSEYPDAVNAMFRHPEDSESDTDSESEMDIMELMDTETDDEEEEERIIEKINAMFDDDEDEEEEQNQFVKFKQYLYRVVDSAFESMKKKVDPIYNAMAKWIDTVYTYLSTKSQVEIVEDLMMTLENGDDAVNEYSKRMVDDIRFWIAVKYYGLKTVSKDKISRIMALLKKEEIEVVETAVIKPSRAKRRRYGKIWKKHVDLSDGGIFSSLTNDSDSDSEES